MVNQDLFEAFKLNCFINRLKKKKNEGIIFIIDIEKHLMKFSTHSRFEYTYNQTRKKF